MRGILSDVDIEGHFQKLLSVLESDVWLELWQNLNLSVHTFPGLGLRRDVPDSLIWQVCQQREIVLLTGNRNKRGPDSLEATIRALGTPASLPVITLANPRKLVRSKPYANRIVERLLNTSLTSIPSVGQGDCSFRELENHP